MNTASDHASVVFGNMPCSICLPAGCGKTEIAAALAKVINDRDLRVLILTHTNAGVEVLRRRLSDHSVSQREVTVATIDSWSHSIVLNRQELAGINVPAEPNWSTHNQIILNGASEVLAHREPRQMVADSYDRLIVDEYQDCSVEQHRLICVLSEQLPTAVFGDPLQGVFDFGNSKQIQWNQHVVSTFPDLQLTVSPWRWNASNPKLGEWLLEIREPLLNGESIDLTDAPVKWEQLKVPQDRIRICNALPRDDGTVVAISGNTRKEAISIARELEGEFSLMEELEGKSLLGFADLVDSRNGTTVAKGLFDFTNESAIGLSQLINISDLLRVLAGQPLVVGQRAECTEQIRFINEVLDTPTPLNVYSAMISLAKLPGFRIYRNEAWDGVLKALQLATASPDFTVRRAVIEIRNNIRYRGRAPEPRIVSRTLLIKGLEYDHIVILDADAHSARNLYVALTRGKKTVTVMSLSPVLHPNSF